ncbi:MAG: hypothetical protein MZU95_01485 [Desulfomicrobium escambiense]|nr:hypothetical protein [Desulfomicrobium escambiense]
MSQRKPRRSSSSRPTSMPLMICSSRQLMAAQPDRLLAQHPKPEIDRAKLHPVRHLLEVLPRRRRSTDRRRVARSSTTISARAAASAPRNARRSASSWWRSGK